MLRPDTLNIIDQGRGYLIGEVRDAAHPQFSYMKHQALVTLFDGVDTALEFIGRAMPTPKRSAESDGENDNDGFHTFSNFAETVEVFTKRPESIVKFDPGELRIRDANEAGTAVDYDVTGDYIDMGRYLEGTPESFGTMRNGNARNRRVNILISLTNAGSVKEYDIIHRSERILRLVDALEASGVRCQLTGIEGSQCSHTEVILKHHDEPLTVSDLAVVTHPEFLRRIIFRITEYSKTFESGYGSGIALGKALTTDLLQHHNLSVNELDIVIDGNLRGKEVIDELFDRLERLLVWEMSKPVPEVDAIKVDSDGVYFEANGARSEAEIQREGREAIRAEN